MKVNPTYLTPVDPHCCKTKEWWDINDCVGYKECSLECVSNPFDPDCLVYDASQIFGCCSFYGGGLTPQDITTY